MVRLKKNQETFTVMSGEDAGRTFERDVEYQNAPEGEEHRFEKVRMGVDKKGRGVKKIGGKK